jgi:hypothetical protein
VTNFKIDPQSFSRPAEYFQSDTTEAAALAPIASCHSESSGHPADSCCTANNTMAAASPAFDRYLVDYTSARSDALRSIDVFAKCRDPGGSLELSGVDSESSARLRAPATSQERGTRRRRARSHRRSGAIRKPPHWVRARGEHETLTLLTVLDPYPRE